MPSHTRSVAVIALALLVVLAGCGGLGGSAGGGADGGSVNASSGGLNGGSGAESAGATAAASGGGDAGAADAETGNQQALQANRATIKTAHVRLEVESFDTARENITTATRRLGGYVGASSESTRGENGNRTAGQVVLRVPSRNFSTLYDQVQATGTVLSATTNTSDVTEQLVDLEARLENLRAQRQRLRDLYENASDTEAVLAVQERLSNTQSEIERLEARLQSLENRIALSTITVELTEPADDPVAAEAWYDVGVIDAFVDSIGGVVTTLRAAVVALAYLAPYLLVFGVPLLLGYLVYRRRTATSASAE
jgi:polyhydroxyalkanoate synthesis regulator phasin